MRQAIYETSTIRLPKRIIGKRKLEKNCIVLPSGSPSSVIYRTTTPTPHLLYLQTSCRFSTCTSRSRTVSALTTTTTTFWCRSFKPTLSNQGELVQWTSSPLLSPASPQASTFQGLYATKQFGLANYLVELLSKQRWRPNSVIYLTVTKDAINHMYTTRGRESKRENLSHIVCVLLCKGFVRKFSKP